MKKIIFIAVLIFGIHLNAQTSNQKYKGSVKTLDSTIKNLYGVISGEKEEERDWDLMRYLFHPEAKMVATAKDKDGHYKAHYLTVEEYIEKSGKWLVEHGFFENEINREVQTFGNITQVFSTYECFHSTKDTKPFMRGINSIQLMNDGQRWWVITIYWTQESKENPIPKQYLPKS